MATTLASTVEPYITHLKARGLASGTVRRHRLAIAGSRTGLIGSAQRIKGAAATTGQLDHSVIDAYFAADSSKGGGRANKIQVLKSYLRFLEGRNLLRPGFTAKGLMDAYKGGRGTRQPKHYIPVEQFGELIEMTSNERDRAFVAITLYTLARQGEVTLIDFAHLDLDARKIGIYREKTKRWTSAPVPAELMPELLDWLTVYASLTGYGSFRDMMIDHPEWHLVPSRHTFRGGWVLRPELQASNLEDIVKDILTGMGVKDVKGEGAHTIRRSGARALYDRLTSMNGHEAALTTVQAILDHDDPKMTLRYIGLDWVKEQAHEFILEHGMYGAAPKGGTVIPFRKAV